MLNFITYEEAQEVLYDSSYEEYKEYFDAQHSIGFATNDAEAIIDVTSIINKNSKATDNHCYSQIVTKLIQGCNH